MVKNLEEILELAKDREKKTLSVAVAEDKQVLVSVVEAFRLGIINAILVGDKEKIENIAKEEELNIDGIKVIDEKDKLKAVKRAVECITKGEANFIMKGMISTSDILKAVLNKEANLRGKNLLSHIMIYDVPTYHKLIFVTDGGIVPYPQISEKMAIVQNAVEVAHSLGIKMPKVAPICAVEVVNPNLQSTLDAATLTQMNKRGQLSGCIIDGPLALDNAISKEAAEHKKIKSEVAGDADILLVPSMESGNFLAKSITYFARGRNAGIVVGAKCPIVLVSRADTARSKLYSIALGSIACNK
ncbi:phosphate butyryltransferase [Clostridium niameyense]|uniref:Phosphate butyryltransferase n=1 Tax=Clostridium niameyense TaxID=1622073 RepID=A0A6M0RE31_9CLOT|nr:phosphate butyryltransferase [Clostridium niameyense]NEZ47909.1 phosphate butyryltransferase [Clostridium niameyense]